MDRVVPGSVIGDGFVVERELGRGGFGTVFLAKGPDGTRVAIKVLHQKLGGDEDEERRFTREAELASRLSHPNIVSVLGWGRSEFGLYIVFEYLTGSPLHHVLRTGPIKWQQVASIARQTLSALAAAHDAGIMHRDIKPPNILLCGETAKVLDFGIAKAFTKEGEEATKLTQTGQLLGTARYMAPEQVRGHAVDARADLYAFGLVMCEMITGKRLIEGGSDIERLLEHVSADPHVLPDAIKRTPLAPVIARAITKDREGRFANGKHMLAALERAMLPQSLGRTAGGTEMMPAREEKPASKGFRLPRSGTADMSGNAPPSGPALPFSVPPSGPPASVSPASAAPASTPSPKPDPETVPLPVQPKPAPRKRGWIGVIIGGVAVFVAGVFLTLWLTGSLDKKREETSVDDNAGEETADKKKKKKKKKKKTSTATSAASASASGAATVAKTVEQLRTRVVELGWRVEKENVQTFDHGVRTQLTVVNDKTDDAGAIIHYRYHDAKDAEMQAHMMGRTPKGAAAVDGSVMLATILQSDTEKAKALLKALRR